MSRNDFLTDVFTRLGLGVSAAPVYMTLEKHGPLFLTEIIRYARLHRPAGYRGIAHLERMGFIVVEKVGMRKQYKALPRAYITKMLKGLLDEVGEGTQKQPGGGHDSVTHRNTTVFEGDKSVRDIFDDVIASLKRGETFYRYTSERDVNEINSLLSPAYRAHRDNKRLERLVISNTDSGIQKRKRLERFIKYLGDETEPFTQDIIQLVYADKVAIIDVTMRTGFVIQNQRLADFQKIIFKALYKKLS